MVKPEPQQPEEGKLISKIDAIWCRHSGEKCVPGFNIICSVCDVYKGCKAQLAHDKATMVKIDWLFESCPHSTDPLFLATRHECDECMEELTR